MAIKSFRERAEELEREEFPQLSLNGMYGYEFQEWLRENRNQSYNCSVIDTDNFKSVIEISLNKMGRDIKQLSSFTQFSRSIFINNLSSEYILQNTKSVFFNQLNIYDYEVISEVKSGEGKAA